MASYVARAHIKSELLKGRFESLGTNDFDVLLEVGPAVISTEIKGWSCINRCSISVPLFKMISGCVDYKIRRLTIYHENYGKHEAEILYGQALSLCNMGNAQMPTFDLLEVYHIPLEEQQSLVC